MTNNSIDSNETNDATRASAAPSFPTTGAIGSSAMADYVVPPAMLAVAIASGLASYLHLGFAPEFAAAIGLALFCIMLLGHVLLRPAERIEQAGEAVDRDVASPLERPQRSGRPRPQRQPVPSAAARGVHDDTKRTLHDAPEPVAEQPGRELAPAPPSLAARVEAALPDALALGRPTQGLPPSLRAAAPHAHEHWTYRPLDLQLPDRVEADVTADDQSPSLSTLRPAASEEPTATTTFGTPALSEPERVEQILKRLAAQIRAGGHPVAAASLAKASVNESGAQDGEPAPSSVASANEPELAEPATQAEADASLESAVSTLRSTVEAMRADLRWSGSNSAPGAQVKLGGHGTPTSATPTPTPTSASASAGTGMRQPTAAEVRLAAVAEALAAERANVFLQPILSLRDDRAQNFEVSVRLRTRDGQVLERQQVADHIRGAGLLPLLDAIGVRHSAGFALKLERRGRDGAVFSQVAGESLESADFVNDVAVRQAQGIADRLILSFDQEEIRGLGTAQMNALASLSELGFRFAIERLSHLDMDFEALVNSGFAFVKLDADVFARGLALGGAGVSPRDLSGFFRDLGLAVIVGHIDNEAMRDRMLEYGVVFGQGALFGEPRPVPVGTLDAGDSVAA